MVSGRRSGLRRGDPEDGPALRPDRLLVVGAADVVAGGQFVDVIAGRRFASVPAAPWLLLRRQNDNAGAEIKRARSVAVGLRW